MDSRLNLIQKRLASPASLWLWIAAIWIRFLWNDLELKGTKVRNEIERIVLMIGRVLIGFGRNHRMRIEWMKHTAAMFFSLSTKKERKKEREETSVAGATASLVGFAVWAMWAWAKPYLRSMDERRFLFLRCEFSCILCRSDYRIRSSL